MENVAMTLPPCYRCKSRLRLHVSERQGEGEDDDRNLIATHCYEAWAECPTHGWVSPRLDVRTWSREKPLCEPLNSRDHRQAVAGLLKVMTR